MQFVKKSHNLRMGIGLLAFALLVLSPAAGRAVTFDAIFGFGDSLMDGGNVAIAIDEGALLPFVQPFTREAVPLPPDDLVPGAPYAVPGSGPERFDNFSAGPAWITLLAEDLGVPAPASNDFLSDIGDPTSADPSIAGGANFAFGGARSGPPLSLPPSFLDQVGLFGLAGIAPTADSLFVVGIGGNNVRDAVEGPAMDETAAIAAYGADLRLGLGGLVGLGARQFFVANIPDVGNAPDVVGSGNAADARQLTLLFNAELEDALDDVEEDAADLGIDLSITLFDQFAFGDEIFGDPGAFGITNTTDACAADEACLDDPGLAAQYAFWDGIHPTAALQRITADEALRVIPEPGVAALLCVGLALLGARRRIIHLSSRP